MIGLFSKIIIYIFIVKQIKYITQIYLIFIILYDFKCIL